MDPQQIIVIVTPDSSTQCKQVGLPSFPICGSSTCEIFEWRLLVKPPRRQHPRRRIVEKVGGGGSLHQSPCARACPTRPARVRPSGYCANPRPQRPTQGLSQVEPVDGYLAGRRGPRAHHGLPALGSPSRWSLINADHGSKNGPAQRPNFFDTSKNGPAQRPKCFSATSIRCGS